LAEVKMLLHCISLCCTVYVRLKVLQDLQETAEGQESSLVPASIVIVHFPTKVKLCKTWNQV